ncbi:MAG: prepilin-type N-terminal cleavage/methylation domain-containing protein [Sedimentisphaerales bacterium]|nr:prepilin-type N-terminal cleavage/methylation domain-containing protein [Sedimentisphaerales bacterium]
MTVKQHKSKTAFTIVEVMVAVLIVAIVVIGGSFLFVMGKAQISRQKRFRAATQLASQKLEQLKAGSYDSIADESNSVVLEGITYTRIVDQEPDANGLYKQVTVTVGWNQGAASHDISMVTCIAPK